MACTFNQFRLKVQALLRFFAKPCNTLEIVIDRPRKITPLTGRQRKYSSLQWPVRSRQKQDLNSECTVRVSHIDPRTDLIAKVP